MALLLETAKNRWTAPPLESLSAVNLAGKTVLVTGASGGLGLEAARHYARLGASRVILAVRSQVKGSAAQIEIQSSLLASNNEKRCHGHNSATSEIERQNEPILDVWTLDMASFESVRAFAARAVKELDRLDIVLLNAAVSKDAFTPTSDGWDETLQVNVYSTVLLALLLLPKLRQTSRMQPGWTPRLSIVVARAHEGVHLDEAWQKAPNCLRALNSADALGGTANRYIVSKFLLVMAVREIAKLACGTGGPDVVVTCSCPGACRSDLTRDWDSGIIHSAALAVLHGTISKTSEEGSRTLVLATLLDEKNHGQWLNRNKIQEVSSHILSDEGQLLQQKIWSEILEVVGPVS
ncbi:NAD(P)-binding protein [Thozetella sp. PMI_491]|nr:NAD(P)-binding protein [Thozetella sp. PMI_491]